MSTGEARRIALLLGQEASFYRDVIRGIRTYAINKKEWVLHNGPPELRLIRPLRQWKPDGIIAHLSTAELARSVLKLRKPVVDTACMLRDLEAPTVDVDHAAVGRLAAEYFLERGFHHFGFFGSNWARYSTLREESFRRRLAEAGRTLSSCYADYFAYLSAPSGWRAVDRRVEQWLRRLPKPVAIFSSNDPPARDLADACLRLGLSVPEEVALLGVDNDEVECRLTYPSLSSIAVPAHRVGYEAARILDCLMSAGPAPEAPLFLPPIRVVTRQSTDILAIDDRPMAAALRFIREHAAERIGVETIAAQVGISRRLLECKFRALSKRTVLQELRRVRLEMAKELLVETDLAMPAIAARSGFANAKRLALVFRQLTGISPTAYRRQGQATHT
jgi:LacI family transcriptional regulator